MAEMDWERLLTKFRALGGIADNIVIRHGPMGRGVFPIEPRIPIRLRTPPNLLVRCSDTELRSGRLVTKRSANLGERERSFFEMYQEDFCWSAGTLNQLWQEQLAWSELPAKVQEKLQEMGPDPDRFAPPNADLCYRRYLATRQFNYRGTPVLMPLVELINHRERAGRYDISNGIGVEYTPNDEVNVDYGPNDCWGMAMVYGFCPLRGWAYSLNANFIFEEFDIGISRKFFRNERVNGLPIPMIDTDGAKLRFSHLMLGHVRLPHVPRTIFSHAVKTTPIKQPDELFDLIQHHNRTKFIEFLRLTDEPSTPLAATLRKAAQDQLEALSA